MKGKVSLSLFCVGGQGDPRITVNLCHFHLDQNVSYLPLKILHNHCFQFFLGITVVPREMEDNGYAKFWGVNKMHSGLGENGELHYRTYLTILKIMLIDKI